MNQRRIILFQKAKIVCTSLALLPVLLHIATSLTNANDDGLGNSRQRETRITYDDEVDIDLSLVTASPLLSPTAPSNSLNGAGGGGSSNCERINVRLCSKMNYNFTRMPNHFKDSSQIDVDVRANLYSNLVKSKCSPYIHAYICELLTPVCSNDLTMRKFEIYPCRTFCKQIKMDCQEEIFENAKRIRKQISPLNHEAQGDPIYNSFMETFDCDLLPYEYNGGNGTNGGGPCHEVQPTITTTTSSSLQPSSPVNYDDKQVIINHEHIESSPYQPYVPDINNPPFITDTSKIDPTHIKPIDVNDLNKNQNNKHQTNDNRNHILLQIQSFGQNAYWTLQKYSNIISVATVMILLVALFSKHLARFKDYLSFTPSSSSKSSLSSTSSNNHIHNNNNNKSLLGGSNHLHHQKLFANNSSNNTKIISGYPAINGQMSPSSSSRSLMLTIGAGSNGKQQAPHHKLINNSNFSDLETSSTPSQQLLLGLNSKKTMINVNNNETLERQQQKLNGSINGKYLLQMQRNAQASAIRHHYVHHQQQQFHHHSSSDKQQLFNTLDSNSSHSNQYDVIQLDEEHYNASHQKLHRNHPNQRSTTTILNHQSKSQQLYSNILLSSPSHQVLLFNGPINNGSVNNGQINNNHIVQSQQDSSGTSTSTVTRKANLHPLHNSSSPKIQPPQMPGSSRHQPGTSFFTNLTATTTVSQLTSPYADPTPSSSSSTIGSRRLG